LDVQIILKERKNRMKPRFETLTGKTLIGMHRKMSFARNETSGLWKSFMPRRKEIRNSVGIELYSVEVYPPSFFDTFNPMAEFEKWASVEVSDVGSIPRKMEILILPPGLYAVFVHKGPVSKGPETYQYIFGTWLPGSGFIPDNRPHFAVMGEKYKYEDPDSEEEIWIPVKPKV
jgi:AraC family transcriptional regulator